MRFLSSHTSARRGLRGFSIIEATIGLGVAGTVIVALFSGFTNGFFTMQMARENQRATQIMLEKTETIRLYSWDQLETPNFIPPTFTATYDPQHAQNQGVVYRGTMTIQPADVSVSYSNELKRVRITLTWQTGGIVRNREFTSLIARDGLQSYIY